MVTLPIVTRALGPEKYGIFSYLTVFYEKIIQFFDVGTSAFYPKLSRRPGDKGIVRFVILYDAILLLVTFIILGLLFAFGNVKSVLTVESLTIAFSALLLAWLLIINSKMTSYMDALGKTTTNEVILMIMRFTLSVGLVALFFSDALSLNSFLHLQNATLVIFLLVLTVLAFKFFPSSNNSKSVKETAKEFKEYGLPLFWASTVGVVSALADRWLLQIYGGSAAQGYFSLGFNLGAICFLITGSLTPLLMREYAIAYENNDKKRLAHLFSKYLPLFYVITSTIACFLAVHGDWLARLVGGGDFSQASLPVMLLGMATIHQTYGQLSGSLMVATDRTREYGGISMFESILGLPVTYFVLAPEENGGLNLGATGLAIKLVVLQIIAVNIQLWFNTRQLGIGMGYLVMHQVLVIFIFILFAFVGKSIIGASLGAGIMALLISGLLYLTLVLSVIFSISSKLITLRSGSTSRP